MLAPFGIKGVKSFLGGAGAILKLPKPVSQVLGNVVVGRCWRHLEATKPVTPQWGKVVVVERCWRHLETTGQGGAKSLLGSEATKPVSQDWASVVGRCWRHFEATKPVGQD